MLVPGNAALQEALDSDAWVQMRAVVWRDR